jgi:2-oxoglutarate ferredoxin oxidoreductase subunit delta
VASVTILKDACKGVEDCGICIFVCPKDLFVESGRMNAAGYIPPKLQNEDDCIKCQNCMIYCPDFAIIAEGKEKAESDEREVEHE